LLFATTKQPRYAKVADALMQDIVNGVFPRGSLLPPEGALCERFNVSRATVREALRQLSESGIVSKAHGIGTRVESTEVKGEYVLSVDSISDLMQYGTETQLRIFDRRPVVATAEMAAVLGCKPGTRWIRLRGLRMLDRDEKYPFSFSEILIDERFSDVAGEDSPTISYYKEIEARYGEPILGIDQEISAIDIPKDVAAKLGVEPGSSGLKVVRRFCGAGNRALEVTTNIHPKNRFNYKLHVNRATPK
jgi:DNA-binding GntR family transcriptional regulator